jgi:hypothetical protein
MLQFQCSCKEEQKKKEAPQQTLYSMDAAHREAQRAQRFLGGTGKLYKPSLDHLMSFIVGRPFARNYIYSDDELNAITPAHVLQWMNFRTFGTINPAVDANPISARSSSLQYWKKAISFFHPNRLMVWSAGRNEGNPTRSVEINNLIKRVKKKEVRKQGVASQTRRAITELEFRTLHTVFRDVSNSMLWRYGMSAMINFQFHVIARIDDTTQLLIDHIRVHDSFPNCLKTKLNWSKNVGDERDAPWQIVMGSMDTTYCVLVSMAIWMEINMRANANAANSPYLFSFSDDVAVPSGGLKAKCIAQTIFGQKVFKMEQFCNTADSGSLLGSHSIRKYAATHARKCGCNKDEKDIRGRWKSKGRVSDVYDDVELPYPDAKVAEKLSIGGACFYMFPNEDANVNGGVIDATIGNNMEMLRTFVLTQVVPNIRRRVPESCALVLGKALLWFIYCDDAISENFLPEEFKSRIKLELNEILTASGVDVEVNNFNPIRRVPVIVSGDQGSVFIDCIEAEDQEGQQVGGGGAVVGGVLGPGGRPAGGMNAQLMAVHSLATQLRREIHEIKLAQVADRAAMQRCFGIVNTGLRRIGMAPAFRIVQGGGVGAGHDDNNILAAAGLQNLARAANASLSPCPRNLYDLWTEYTVGFGGRKPASQFSHCERGKSKHKFFRRNVVWKMVKHLVDLGITSDMAIDRIYAVYGAQTSVTKIINAIIDDKKRGRLNPNLVM